MLEPFQGSQQNLPLCPRLKQPWAGIGERLRRRWWIDSLVGDSAYTPRLGVYSTAFAPRGVKSLDKAGKSSNITASPNCVATHQLTFGEDMTIQTTSSRLIRLLCGFSVLLMIASAAMAQPAEPTVKRLGIKSTVLV